MENYFDEAIAVMNELYGKDTAMPVATVNGDKANIRMVNTYYKNNMFYIVTYALSNKVRELSKNSNIALNHNLFVAHGTGENIGHPLDEKNRGLKDELKRILVSFYQRHVNEEDQNTCILKVTLNDALVFANDYKYFIDYKNKTAARERFVADFLF